ncbi:Tex family protein [Alicyclobacillus herbarius]|uniref:Tex family protein n=1 Tax=Alicyclobacillus herbarius TaxID=122960 RepID=UPI0006888484|nr:Tex family protein [Alicyclobacillus herbarius]
MISATLTLKPRQVEAAIRLLDEGNTIPFIARYRKEATGELDENQLREIAEQYEFEKHLYQRKCDVLRLLQEQGVLSVDEVGHRDGEGSPKANTAGGDDVHPLDPAARDKLIAAIQAARTLTEIEDLYRPYRPKRRTRASKARECGLGPLAEWLAQPEHLGANADEVREYATSFVSDTSGVATVEDALQGAADILAEGVADDAETRKWLREYTYTNGSIRSTAVDPDRESVYEAYYDYEERLTKTLPHRVLAMNRGEREEFLRVSVIAPQDEILRHLVRRHMPDAPVGGTIQVAGSVSAATQAAPAAPAEAARQIREAAIVDAYKRLLAPAIEREIRAELTAKAEEHAIHIFAENLKNLLMQPPIRGRVVLGVDPAYRTGCKLAVVDDTGKLLCTAVIYPTPPQNKVEAAKQEVLRFIAAYQVELIAIGNGTASRETEAFIADCVRAYQAQSGKLVPYAIVSEAGASVYSASKLAGEEFPNLDVSERSAISIARRLQDPLAELVKIDPKSIGVGQYQHDVSQRKLDEQLAAVVESVVNQVGVDVNTASPSLLSYVAGLNKTVARNIVEFREQNGRFQSRKELAKVPRLGPKTLEQCVGFLRVTNGEEPLDATPIHPESYDAVKRLLSRLGEPREFFSSPKTREKWLNALKSTPVSELAAEIGVGVPTLRDILDALERPGRDPREDVPPPILRTDVLKLEDLELGMELMGTVRNVVDFGAFVDIGIKTDGLVHISQLADHFVKHPMDVVSVGDVVKVRVIQIDAAKGRVGLSMKGV